MNNDTVQLRLATAQSPTPNEVDFCARFADYELEFVLGETVSEVEARADGSRWRDIGRVAIVSHRKVFRVFLHGDANAIDKEMSEKLVERVKAGEWLPWGFDPVPSVAAPRSTNYISNTIVRRIGLARDELAAQRLIVCSEPRCRHFRQLHEYVDDGGEPYIVHEADEFQRDVYGIVIRKNGSEPWAIDFEDLVESLSPALAASIASDLQWLAAECRALNEAVAA